MDKKTPNGSLKAADGVRHYLPTVKRDMAFDISEATVEDCDGEATGAKYKDPESHGP